MRIFSVMGVVAVLASIAHAAVWVTPYRCDEMTPLPAVDPNEPTVYRDIMVGTHLVLVVSSDSDRSWTGALYILWEDLDCGELNGRGYVPKQYNYVESCLAAAGPSAYVQKYGGNGMGYGLWTSDNRGLSGLDPIAGDWFVIDYEAKIAGSCDVVLCDFDEILGFETLVEVLSFTHVASRDFNGDNLVNFEDFVALSLQWRTTTDPDPNNPNVGLDLNSDQQIDVWDLALFSDYWLAQTDCTNSIPDQNDLESKP